MKFLVDKDGVAFNIELIERIYATRIYDSSNVDETHGLKMTNFFEVAAAIYGEKSAKILDVFKSDNETENFRAAKKYFNEVVDLVKKDMTFIFEEGGRSVSNIKFVKNFRIEPMYSEDMELTYILAQTAEDREAEGTVLKEFNEEADEIFLDARDYLADLVKTLNAKKTNFIIYENGDAAINVAFIKNIFIFQNEESSGVMAELIDDDDENIIFTEFNTGDAEKDFEDAKNSYVDLLKELNGVNRKPNTLEVPF